MFVSLLRKTTVLVLPLFLGLPPASAELDLPTAAGQLFIFGLPYGGPGRAALDQNSIKHFKSIRAGSFILFRRDLQNSVQIKDLTDRLHELGLASGGVAALISVDQEGGSVTRIPFSPPLPSARALGLGGNAALSEQVGKETATFLRQLGINGNLAPVLDLGSESPSFIGSRSYSTQAPVVSDMGNAFAQGLVDGKVLPVGKHFPGIGPVTNDPHLTLVRRSTPANDLLTRDLLPFRKFSALYPSGLMISHLIYPTLDPLGTPGTFSKEIHQKYARDVVGYQGLLMTDDLLMIKTKSLREFQDNIQKTFIAGADLIMISWSIEKQKAAIEALLAGVRAGTIKAEDVVARAKRVIQVRRDLGRPVFSAPLVKDRIALSPSATYTKALDQLANQIFKREIASQNIPSVTELALLSEQPELVRAFKKEAPTVPIRRLKSAGACKANQLCLAVLRYKREVAPFLQATANLKKEQRSRILVLELFDDGISAVDYNKISMPVRTPQWARQFAQHISAGWFREKVASTRD